MDCVGVSRLADHLGIKPAKAAKKEKALDDGFEWQPWSPDLVAHYVSAKQGITERALLLAGAKLARYRRKDAVIVLPVYGPTLELDKPINYVIQSVMGRDLIIGTGENAQAVSKKLIQKGKGLLGYNIERLKLGTIQRVWKVEGVTDMLALLSVMTDEELETTAVVSSASGASEKPAWMGDVLAGFDTLICHDLDRPGDAGAQLWAREISLKRDEGATIVRLPGEVTPTHGTDLRDWLNQGNGYSVLLSLAEQGDRIVAKRDAAGDIVADESVDLVFERAICRDLQIEVLGEMENGHIRVFSMFHRKAVNILDIGRLSYAKLLQMFGPPVKAFVHTGKDDIDGMHSLKDVVEAIGAIAGYRQIGDHDTVGQGVWAGRDLNDQETGSIVLVNAGGASRYNGDKVLREVLAPRVDGLLLDMNGDRPWYDHDMLVSNLEALKANPEAFGKAAVRDLEAILARWRWRTSVSPMLMTGCVLASFIQTVLRWRPQVSISGESNAGKSYLFECLGGPDDQSEAGIFLKLAFKSSKSSEAGIRQTVKQTAVVVMCDEFEASKERDRILELMRTSSRSSNVTRGSVGQKASSSGLRHICWIAAIETGLTKQADQNRFIVFNLLCAEKEKQGQLRLPTSAERWELGHRLLAVAIYHAQAACELAVALRDTQIEGIDARQVENYAVPAAMLGLANQYTIESCQDLLRYLVRGNVEIEEQGQTDHEDLLTDILTSQIMLSPADGVRSILQVLESQDLYYRHAHLLDSRCIKVTKDQKLFIHAPSVLRFLLKGTQWEHKQIRDILLRIKGAEPRAQRFAGRTLRGVALPVDALMVNGKMSGDDSEGHQEPEMV